MHQNHLVQRNVLMLRWASRNHINDMAAYYRGVLVGLMLGGIIEGWELQGWLNESYFMLSQSGNTAEA